MSSSGQLLNDIELYIRRLFENNPNPKLEYHNLQHTISVVKAADLMAAHYRLNESDFLALRTAAWFHDAGYLFETPSLHEERSVLLAHAFLRENGVNHDILQKVEGCILATKLPQAPKNLLEEILCDADLFHLGTDNFKQTGKMMRREKDALSDSKISGEDWRAMNISFLESHSYFTTFAQAMLNKGKAEHLQMLKNKVAEKLAKQEAGTNEETVGGALVNEADQFGLHKNEDENKNKDKKFKPGRGVETMFRVTSANHIRISEMADNKANILISINSIIISVLISFFIHRLDEFPNLIIPTILFLACCLTTMTLAILATRPNLRPKTSNTEEQKIRNRNLLFFGSFYGLKLSEYEKAMKEMLHDDEVIYESLIRNIYFLGLVLERKYRLIRYAYSTFMYGFMISVIAFLIAVALSSGFPKL